MRHSRRNGLIAAVVAGGGLAVAGVGGLAHADADAAGKAERSPGLLSGNLVQLPVNAPVNLCGNTVSVVGVLNSATGNRCANEVPGGGRDHPGPRSGHASNSGPGTAGHGGGAVADGRDKDSPGVLSGNGLQLPIELPLNVSGNSVNVVGIGNTSNGNTSVNGETPSGPKPVQPPVQPPVVKPPVTPPAPQTQSLPPRPAEPRPGEALAHTGADGVGYLLPGGGALLLGGVLLYRRFRLN
ncbi:chaplin [Streptomyces antarcticus]|uniref:chaplin n=1 Tax=Streptomyces antarcticus TaxID=2996458 RepID=UPI0022703537|nr:MULTISPECIES: chaplin [unclassified Streptomyces]MCY0945581.1 chaplin [Streptomyces sp. H34-AA3]MCZ4085520.1 chaplin [Streptomyces sp. H34-S5]